MSSMLTVAGGVVLGWIVLQRISPLQGDGPTEAAYSQARSQFDLGNCRHAPLDDSCDLVVGVVDAAERIWSGSSSLHNPTPSG